MTNDRLQQLTYNPNFKGSNTATAGTGRKYLKLKSIDGNLLVIIRVTNRLGKKWPVFLKSSQNTVVKSKNAKFFTSNLNLKIQNIYIKPLLKLLNAYNILCFETAHLCENIKKLLNQKLALNINISLGYFLYE
jgi:hypothetical protein